MKQDSTHVDLLVNGPSQFKTMYTNIVHLLECLVYMVKGHYLVNMGLFFLIGQSEIVLQYFGV